MRYLLDTNVIHELRKWRGDRRPPRHIAGRTRPRPSTNALIAGTAPTRDFERAGVEYLKPWSDT